MRTRIVDPIALGSISPAALRGYAIFEGWKQVDTYKDTSAIYERRIGSRLAEIVVPVTRALADYPSVVSQLISIFAEQSDRDESAVFRDLTHADRDVIRVRAPGAEDDNSIQINAGVEIISEARNMLAAAACSAREPRSSFHVGKVQQVSEYMTRVRLGQTEPGSFVVTLLAPVPPKMSQNEQGSLWPALEQEPYDRQVTRVFAHGLEAAKNALAALNRGRDFSVFEEAVPAGVSANLCDAVAAVVERSHGADLSVTWARTRPAPSERARVIFSQNDAEPLREVARQFRLREPRFGVTLLGNTTNLHRGDRQEGGKVTFAAFIDDVVRSVTVDLARADYELAVEAHRRRQPIIIVGDLVRDGQRWHLRNPRELATLAPSP